MALLCLFFIACDNQEQVSKIDTNLELETRSIDNIVLVFKNESGVDYSIHCTHVEVDFYNSSIAELFIEYEDASSDIYFGEDIRFEVGDGFQLETEVDNSVSFKSSCLSILVLEEELSYSTANPNFFGFGASFVVDDEPAGF